MKTQSACGDVSEALRKLPFVGKQSSFFFFRPTPLGFRQVVQHVRLHVAAMSELVN